MSIFEQYNVTPAELGLTDEEALSLTNEENELVEDLAKATLASREAHEDWLAWLGDRTKKNFLKEEKKRQKQYFAAEEEREKAVAALKIALMGVDEYLAMKLAEKEKRDEEYELELQKDYDGFYYDQVFDE
jgi:hypothetical protein